MIQFNNSFELGWNDMPPAPGNLINQEPIGWSLSITDIGAEIFDTGFIATGIPECVHKHYTQLPPAERPGGSSALILEGEYTYDMFHRGAKFGVQLSTTVSSLDPNKQVEVNVPINVHFDDLGGDEPDDVEVRVLVSGGSEVSVIKSDISNRQWYNIKAVGTVDMYGEITLRLRFIARWEHTRNFFVDNLSATYVEQGQVGDAVTPYSRIYVRVNQNATFEEWLTIAEWAYDRRYTVGFSNDDAGIGVGLSHKKIIEVGQEFDKAVIEQWYIDNYGVTDVEHRNYNGELV